MVEHSFYRDTYRGITIPEEDFRRMSIRAESQLSYFEDIFVIRYRKPSDAYSECVDSDCADFMRNMALCAIAEELFTTETATQAASIGAGGNITGNIKSVSIGSVSASFDGRPIEDITKTESKRIQDALRPYADVYRGVCR